MSSTAFVLLLLDAGIKSALVLMLMLGLVKVFSRSSSAIRHLLLAMALCACLGLPLLTLVLPAWRVGIFPAPQNPIVRMHQAQKSSATKVSFTPQIETFPLEQAGFADSPMEGPVELDWPLIATAAWAIGAWVVIARMLMGTVLVWLLRYKAQPLASEAWQQLMAEAAQPLGLTRKVRLFVSDDAAMPMATGIVTSIVLLPAEAMLWSRAQLKTVLLHELAHVKRFDCLTQLAATFTCALYWFNPLAWLAARQMRALRELACDDEVLAVGTRASEYASCLVGVAKAVDGTKYTSPLAVGMACSHLEDRIASILNPARHRRCLSWRFVGMITLLIVSLMIPLSTIQPFAQSTVQEQKAKERESRAAEVIAEAEAQQRAIERHKQEIEKHLRALEKHQQAMTESQRQELEKHLQEMNLLQEKDLVEKHRLAAELDRARQVEVMEAALEEQLRTQEKAQESLQRRLLEDALQQELREKAQREMTQQGEELLRLQRAELEAQLDHLRTQYTDKHPVIQETRAHLEALNRTISGLGNSSVRSEGQTKLLLQRAELQGHLQFLLRSYTEKHPDVQSVKRQLDALNREIERLRK
ncbi:MAG: hypothetical protein JST84_33210 [Acidobacteria bacterium]|nr:hypothetical protein [Acidobacteriota bacterium]